MKQLRIALLATVLLATDAIGDTGVKHDLKIAPQPLSGALQALARQSGSQIIFLSRLTEGRTTNGLDGSYTVPEAIGLLLANSGLTFHRLSEQAFEVREMPSVEPKAPVEVPQISQKQIPEILVTGTRGNLNLDISRSEDDVLPYVVFDSRQIQQSGDSNVEDFLRHRLPMNTLQQSYSQNVGLVFGARSQVDLHGFGTNQTLILIDGRRTSNSVVNGSLQQQDLNGIALGAVERIEVLPTSASGIYGGDATGGVINIVLRRDFRGADLTAGYENVIEGEARKWTASLTGGFSVEDGKTNVSVAAFWSDANLLMRRDRNFIREYRDQAFANRPELWLPPAIPPLGYTSNIRSTEGNLTLDDGTALNSLFTHVPVGYAGATSDDGAALVANAGQYNFDLADSGQNPGASIGGRVSLVDNPSAESVNVTIRREFGSRVQVFLDASASNSVGRATTNGINSRFFLPADAPNNPFQQEIEVLAPVPSRDFARSARTSDRRVVAGVISELPWDWKAELDYVWHNSGTRLVVPQYQRPGTGTALDNAVQSDPRFNPLRDTNLYRLEFSPYMTDIYYDPFETTTRDLTLLLGGPVARMSGGIAAFSVRLEHREEIFGGGTFRRGETPVLRFPEKSQTVSSAVAELRVPLFSASNAHVLARELEIQLSARRDDFSIRGTPGQVSPAASTPIPTTSSSVHSVNPTAGLRWKPVQDVMIRTSYGTGFLPPNVTQVTPLAMQPTAIQSTLLDPRRGNLPIGSIISIQSGGNPELTPEKSESWSTGVIYTPRWLQGMRLSVDYTKIDRADRIAGHPFAAQGLIYDEVKYPDRIARGIPTPEEAARGWPGPITFIDITLMNIARAKTEAFDVQLDYDVQADGPGNFQFHALATWNRHNVSQTKAGEPRIDNVGFTGGVPDYRINAGLTWNRSGLTLGWNTQYFDSYLAYPALGVPLSASQQEARRRLVQAQGSEKVSSQVYHDAFARYRFGKQDESQVIFGIRNILNARPPREQASYSTYGDPRLASYYLGVTMSLQ